MYARINKKATGERIRLLMIRGGVTVHEVTDALHLGSVQSVYHWMSGRSLPTIDNLYALSRLLDVPLEEIICEEDGVRGGKG